MRKLVYFVASTLDGFIADRDGGTDAFAQDAAYLRQLAALFPETFPTHARAALGIDAPGTHFDTVVMGRGTYEPALRLGITSPYAHLRQVVFSRRLGPSTDPAVTITDDDPVAVVRRLKAERTEEPTNTGTPGWDIWLCGGGDLAGQLITEIDELILKLNPIALGAGIPLFAAPSGMRRFALRESRPCEAGVVMLRYAARAGSGPG